MWMCVVCVRECVIVYVCACVFMCSSGIRLCVYVCVCVCRGVWMRNMYCGV